VVVHGCSSWIWRPSDRLDGSTACTWLRAFVLIRCSSGATLLLASSELSGCWSLVPPPWQGSVLRWMLLCRKCEGSGRCSPESFIRFPYFCESERFYDGIPGGGVGDGRWVAGSLALQPAASDLCSTLTIRKMAADGRSSSKLRLGVVPV
jgi:hypothetical protein